MLVNINNLNWFGTRAYSNKLPAKTQQYNCASRNSFLESINRSIIVSAIDSRSQEQKAPVTNNIILKISIHPRLRKQMQKFQSVSYKMLISRIYTMRAWVRWVGDFRTHMYINIYNNIVAQNLELWQNRINARDSVLWHSLSSFRSFTHIEELFALLFFTVRWYNAVCFFFDILNEK